MKQEYNKPEMEIVVLTKSDLVRTSEESETSKENPDSSWWGQE